MMDNVRTERIELHFMEEIDRDVDHEVRGSLKNWKRSLIWTIPLNIAQLIFHMWQMSMWGLCLRLWGREGELGVITWYEGVLGTNVTIFYTSL